MTNRDDLPFYAVAFAELLEEAARRVRLNEGVEQIARDLLPVIKIATRQL